MRKIIIVLNLISLTLVLFATKAEAINVPKSEGPVLSFANKSAIKYRKQLTVGQVEILEFAKPVSLAHYGTSDESLDYIEFDKLKPEADGYKKFMIKAKKPGYGELTFRSGEDLIKVEVIVQNDYQILERQLNQLFGIENPSEEERIKVTPASYIGDISSEYRADAYLYLAGKVKTPKEAMLAVAFAANAVGDKGVKIFSNPGGQLRLKDLDSSSAQSQSGQSGGNEDSFVEFYEATNKLIDTNNLYRDLVLASEEERVISFIKIDEPKRFAVKVRFMEMDARYIDEYNSFLNVTSVGRNFNGAFGSQALSPPSISAVAGANQSLSPTAFGAAGLLSRFNPPGTAALDIASGNAVSGTFKLFNNTILNGGLNDLLNEGVLRVVNEFSLVIHSGERVSLGKGIRFPIPKTNNNVGGSTVSIEYIPIGFKGELKVTSLESGLIDAQLSSRLTTAEQGAAAQVQGLTIPVFKEEFVNSGVLLQDNQEVVLNAFMTESENVARATSPLGRIIPFLGKAKRKDRSKNLLFITLKAEEIEQSSEQKVNMADLRLPNVDLEKNKRIYSDYMKELRAKSVTDTVDIGSYNESKDDALNIDPDLINNFDADPLTMKEEDMLPGIGDN